MKTFRKIFIGALALLFGSWVNMQAQEVSAVEGSTVARVVKHKSPKSLKQQRAEAFIANTPSEIELAIGVKVSYVLSAVCNKKSFTVKASEVFVNVPDAPPVPLWKVKDYADEKTAMLNGLEREFVELKHDRPGEGADKYEMRQDKLKELLQKMTFLRDMRDAVLKAEPTISGLLDNFAKHIISGE
ncbi:MAG: hypothetical protein IKS82_02240 [Bacteroidales bacterium]|nr:hypothetical protein [Bacteroidales bacterium]